MFFIQVFSACLKLTTASWRDNWSEYHLVTRPEVNATRLNGRQSVDQLTVTIRQRIKYAYVLTGRMSNW